MEVFHFIFLDGGFKEVFAVSFCSLFFSFFLSLVPVDGLLRRVSINYPLIQSTIILDPTL